MERGMSKKLLKERGGETQREGDRDSKRRRNGDPEGERKETKGGEMVTRGVRRPRKRGKVEIQGGEETERW